MASGLGSASHHVAPGVDLDTILSSVSNEVSYPGLEFDIIVASLHSCTVACMLVSKNRGGGVLLVRGPESEWWSDVRVVGVRIPGL